MEDLKYLTLDIDFDEIIEHLENDSSIAEAVNSVAENVSKHCSLLSDSWTISSLIE